MKLKQESPDVSQLVAKPNESEDKSHCYSVRADYYTKNVIRILKAYPDPFDLALQIYTKK